jgi:tetratricopeptide (TPR) repeat protein
MADDIEQLIEAGVAAHCAGDRVAAALAYARVLARAPTHAAANFLAMSLAQDAGDWTAARDFEGRAGARPGGRGPVWPPADMLRFARFLHARQRPDLAMALVINVALQVGGSAVEALRAEIAADQAKLVGPAPPPAAFTRDLLVVCPIHLAKPRDLELLALWRTAIERFNPGLDWLMVDDGSPAEMIAAAGFEPAFARVAMPGEDPEPIRLESARTLARFESNAGHLRSSRGLDGWSRSVATGIEAGIASGYRHLVVVEMDLYTRLDFRAIVGQMRASGAKAVTTRVKPWMFIETALMALDVAHLQTIRFTDRYDWKRPYLTPKPEWVYEAILGEVAIMPWTGGRNDFGNFDSATVERLDLLTHCKDIAFYRRFIEAGPPAAGRGGAAPSERARSLAAERRFDEALALYEEAVRLKPDDLAALNGRGLMLERLERFEEALACYERVAAIDPAIPAAHCNRGNVLSRLRRFEEALASYDRALAIRPDYPAALNNRAWALQEAFDLGGLRTAKRRRPAGAATGSEPGVGPPPD